MRWCPGRVGASTQAPTFSSWILMKLHRFAAVLFIAPLFTAGCVVGPNFSPPSPPSVASYSPTPVTTTAATPGVPGGNAQHFVAGADLPADWWTLFHSPQ